MHRDDPDAAEALYQQAHDLAASGEDRRYQAIARGNLGLVHHLQDRLALAEEDASNAVTKLVEIGATRPAGYFFAYAGAVAADRDDLALAEERLD